MIRIPAIAALGFAVYFLLEVIMNLLYRNYPVMANPVSYVGAIALAFLIYVGIRFINGILNEQFPWRNDPRKRFMVQALSNIGFSVIAVAVASLVAGLLSMGSGFTQFADLVVTLVVVAAVTLIVVLGDLSTYLLTNWRTSLAQAEKFQKESVESQLQMLKAQVNPHFLFNSLNTLSSLIYQDQDTAADFLRQLSRVYRYVLESRNKEVILLKEEMAVMDAYIFLLEMRFARNLKFDLQINEGSKEYLIAPMTLQMLVENAIKHNVVSAKRPLEVRIANQGNDVLEVSNNLQKKEIMETSTGMGLRNIRGRYAHLTNKTVEVAETAERFSVTIPLISPDYASSDH